MNASFDLLVIGTGEAGATATEQCRAAGRQVAIVDSRPYGGKCGLRGSKSLGVLAIIVAISVAIYAFFATGSAPIETSAHPLPFEKRLATMDLEARARKKMPHQLLMQASHDNLIAGGKVYIQHCALCHGMPGEQRPDISEGMFPPPPQLYKREQGATGDPAAEMYWKIKNGIRVSGMPAFTGTTFRSRAVASLTILGE